MSRFCALLLACTCELPLVAARLCVPTSRSNWPSGGSSSARPNVHPGAMLDALNKLGKKVEIDGSKIGEQSLTEVLEKLATKHNIVFVINEEAFRTQKIEDIKNTEVRGGSTTRHKGDDARRIP